MADSNYGIENFEVEYPERRKCGARLISVYRKSISFSSQETFPIHISIEANQLKFIDFSERAFLYIQLSTTTLS